MPGPYLSCARRFVLVDTGGRAVADGVQFAGGNQLVLRARDTGHIEVYPVDVLQIRPLAGHIEWIDAERPTPCLPTETGRSPRG